MARILTFSILFLCLLINSTLLIAQEKIDFDNITRKEILDMSYDELLELPLETLMKLADKVGVSTDELFQLVLNKNVSTASKHNETIFESPLATTVITSQEIKNSGAISIPELFRLVPGFIVREKSNGVYDVHIRGNDNVPPGNFNHFAENSMTLVMIDNRIVYNYINGGTFWENIPIGLMDIERIDIIRGPSSALYGANAVSGVVNIITKKPEGTKLHTEGSVQMGNVGTRIFNAAINKKVGEKIGFRISGNYEFRDRFQDDYYCYLKEQYVPDTSVVGLFGNKYFRENIPSKEAKDKGAINAYAYYTPSNNIDLRFAAGVQSSIVKTVFFENLATPLSQRESETGYLDFDAKVGDLQVKTSLWAGRQNLSVGMFKPVIEYDMYSFHANAEYDLKIGKLRLRPGVNFQQAVYDDSEYVDDDNGKIGLINGEKELNSIAIMLRGDYTFFDKLRLTGAVRADKYNIPNKIYYSHQVVASFTVNDNFILRGVHSHANRGAFIGDYYASFKNPLGPQGDMVLPVKVAEGVHVPFTAHINQYYQSYQGNKDLDLLDMDLYEIGARAKITNELHFDVEGFYTITKNFDALVRDTLDLKVTGMNIQNQELDVEIHEILKYENIDVESQQLGISCAINWKLRRNIMFRMNGIWQNTELINFAPSLMGKSDSTINITHKWTPKLFGGVSLDCIFLKKINVYTNLYYLGKQSYLRYKAYKEKNSINLDAKTIVNLKLAYRFYKKNQLFINMRNLLDASEPEFGFADKNGFLFTAGLNWNI